MLTYVCIVADFLVFSFSMCDTFGRTIQIMKCVAIMIIFISLVLILTGTRFIMLPHSAIVVLVHILSPCLVI